MDTPHVMVTGASGFFGTVIVDQLCKVGLDPCVLINSTSHGVPWRLRHVWHRLCVHEANLLDATAVLRSMEPDPPTHVVHAGAFTHSGRAWVRAGECYAVNVLGTQNLLASLAPHNVAVTYVSSSEVYGTAVRETQRGLHPQSPYAVSKLAGEYALSAYVESGQLPSGRIARVYNLFGPGQWPDRLIPEAILASLRGEDFRITAGTQSRDFLYVVDAAEALVGLTLSAREGMRIVDLASGVDRSVADAARVAYAMAGGAGAVVVDGLEGRPNDVLATAAEADDLKQLLPGRSPWNFNDALMETVRWYGDHLELFSPGALSR